VFGAHPIGSFLFSLVVAKFMETWGRKNLMVFGLVVQATTIALFGLLGIIYNKQAFIICSLFSRFF
jgi:MFS family permease